MDEGRSDTFTILRAANVWLTDTGYTRNSLEAKEFKTKTRAKRILTLRKNADPDLDWSKAKIETRQTSRAARKL